MENKLYRVDLIESERGVGKNKYGTILFIEEINALKYIKEYNSKNNLETVPSYYTFAELYGLVEVEMNLENAFDYTSNKKGNKMTYQIPENAIIMSIKEDLISSEARGWRELYEGLIIETDKGSIKLAITIGQCCCANFGSLFFETPDDITQFVGAKILEIEDIDIKHDECIDNETQLRITTDRGIIQYAIYNEHNGYYSHGTILQVFDTIEHEYL